MCIMKIHERIYKVMNGILQIGYNFNAVSEKQHALYLSSTVNCLPLPAISS